MSTRTGGAFTDCHIQSRGGKKMSYAWGAGGAGRSPAPGPLHTSIGIVRGVSSRSPAPASPRRHRQDAPPAAVSQSMSGPAAPQAEDEEETGTEPAAGSRKPSELELRRLAAELAPMVDVWQRLLDQHLPDRAGRCQTCTKGGTGVPAAPWPCSIHGIADLARQWHDRSA